MSSNKRLSLILLVIGLVLAIDISNASSLHKFWPILLTLLGSGFTGIYFKRRKRDGIYLFLGIYTLLFSGLAFYCSFTSWMGMSALWPLTILFTGITLLALFFIHNKSRTLLFWGMFFISISSLFLLLFLVSNQLWWTAFIFLAITIFVSDKPR